MFPFIRTFFTKIMILQQSADREAEFGYYDSWAPPGMGKDEQMPTIKNEIPPPH